MEKKVPHLKQRPWRRFLVLLFLLVMTSVGFAQGVAINTTNAPANPSAGLDINFTDKGFLISRVSLTATSDPAPLTMHIAGMIVYNIATVGDVTKGLYFNDGNKWIPIVLPTGLSIGDMQYWNGTAWVLIPVGLPNQKLKLNSSGVPEWSN